MRSSLSARMAIASGLLAAMVVAVFAVLIASIGQLREAAAMSQRSEEVIAEASELESLALELQSGMRGYLIRLPRCGRTGA